MKVLHFIPTFGSGGAERQLSILAPALVRRGIEVHIAFGKGGPNLSRLEGRGVHLHALDVTSNHGIDLAWKALRLVRRVRPSAVQTWLLQMDVVGGTAALVCGTPFILSERSSADGYPRNWKNHLRVAVGRRASRIVANSAGGLAYWRPHVSDERLRLVRNCIVVDRGGGDTLDGATQPEAKQPLVLFAGRFSYEKNIPNLVEALIEVANSRPDVRIVLFGEGPERSAIARRLVEADVEDRIALAEFTSHLVAWMRRAAVCVSVSHFEGHPNVVMEAAAVGCPLVISDIPSHRELFDESSARLVSPNSVSSISSGILATLNDSVGSLERAERARHVALRFDPETIVSEYVAIYEEAAGASC